MLYSGEYRNEGRRRKIILRVRENGVDREVCVTRDALREKLYAGALDAAAAVDISEAVAKEADAEIARINSGDLPDGEKQKLIVGLKSVESQKQFATRVRNRMESPTAAESADKLIGEYIDTIEKAFQAILTATK